MERNSMRSAMLPDAPARPDNAFTRFLDAAGTGIGDAYRSFMETPDRMRQQIYDYQVSQGVSPEMAALRADRIASRAGMTTGAVDLLVPQTAADVALTAAGPLGRVAPRAGRAALAAGGAMMGAEPSEAQAIFGGEGAKGARNMFWRARQWLNWTNPETAYRRTGVFQAPEGRMMFEIDDSPARLRSQIFDRSYDNYVVPTRHGQATVADILEHPELYKRYPHIAQLPVSPVGASAQFRGSHDPNTGEIVLKNANLNDMRSTLLHEIQHSVQQTENFARGGNPLQFLPSNFAELRGENYRLMGDIHQAYKADGIGFKYHVLEPALAAEKVGRELTPKQQEILEQVKNHPLWEQLRLAVTNNAHLTNLESEAKKSTAQLMGERMARTVQERRNMSAAERRAGGIPRIVD
jgi:hypothetical protein